MEFTYTVIDPNATSSLQLQHYLEGHGDFTCVALATNSDEGLNTILKFSPDIVFVNLDKNAPAYFQMTVELHQYGTKIPLFIGISKVKDHAYKAIKNGFFDYWLMPYDEDEIRKSLLRLKKQQPKEAEPQTVCLQSYSDFHYLNIDDIIYLQANNNATIFVMKDGGANNASKTLKTFEGNMPNNFVRIHQSYIVNVDYISHISYGQAICTLKPGKLQLPFSRSYRENIDLLKKKLAKSTFSSVN